MAAFCLIPQKVDEFKKALKDGSLNPEKLAGMTSSERRKFLEGLVGKENGSGVNALFESKLLLKNKKAGYISWAKRVAGMSKQAKRDIISRIERMNTILNPAEEKAFLEDLAAQRLGVGVSADEAKTISKLSEDVVNARQVGKISELENLSPTESIKWMKDKTNNATRLDYGRKVIALDNYVTGLKEGAKKLTLTETLKNPGKVVGTALDTSKAMNASMDDSALFNQGLPVLLNYKTAGIWRRNSINSFSNLVRTFRGKPVWDEFRADLVSRPNYINGAYKKAGIALNVTEEAYPTSLPEKIPLGVGRTYKATETAFNIFQFKNRADIADMFLAMADKNGVSDLTGLGKLVNSLTGRGSLGKLEPVGNVINAPFFSLRRQAAIADSLTGYQVGARSAFVRKQGALAAIQQVLGIATVLGAASALVPGSVEWDAISADFGKIKIGDTRFDVTMGRGSYITLAARIATGKTKSSSSDKVTDLNSGDFGSKTTFDLFVDFGTNKLSPFLGQVVQHAKGRDFQGNKPTLLGSVIGMYTPLGIQNMDEVLSNPNSANWLITAIANAVGINSNTYPGSNIKTKMIPEGAKISNDSFIGAVQTYSTALKSDPETAFNRIFTGQKIIRTENGAIIVERMTLHDSQALKEKYGANTKEVKLDHTVPLELGGGNDNGNLKLVSTSAWASYTRVENTLGRALKQGKISKSEAQDLIRKFKAISDNKERKAYGERIMSKY